MEIIRTIGRLALTTICAVFVMITLANAKSVDDIDLPENWRDNFKQLRIGLLKTHPSAKDPARLKFIEQSFVEALGVDVKIIKFSSLGALMDAHGSARIHYAIHTARSYVATKRICNCITALARPVTNEGIVGFRSILVTRKSGSITAPSRKLSDMKIGYSRKSSVSGWALPQRAINNGILDTVNMVETGSVLNVINAYSNNEIDGFFGWIPVYENDAKSIDQETALDNIFGGIYNKQLHEGNIAQSFELRWWSSQILHGPHAIHFNVPQELKQELQEFLIVMDRLKPNLKVTFAPYYTGGFSTVKPNDYQAMFNLMDEKAKSASSFIELRPTIQMSN